MNDHLDLALVDFVRGSSIRKKLAFVHQTESWRLDQQEYWQNKQLSKLVDHCYQNVPYYQKLFRSMGIAPSDIKNIKDLQSLPILTKDEVKSNFHDLTASNYKTRKPHIRSTGGTTGEPFQHMSDIDTWSLHWALKIRAWSWSGYKRGDKISLVGGSSIIPTKSDGIYRKAWNRVNNFYPFSSAHFDDNSVRQWYDFMLREKIDFVRGYPSAIYAIAKIIERNGLELSLRGVQCTAEVLYPFQKSLISRVFKANVFDNYGCADGGGNANTCKSDNGFHISFEPSIMELTNNNGECVKPGETGAITLTNLSNYAMPFLRYRPEDLGVEDETLCKCGRETRMLSRLVGRTTDLLEFPNGRIIAGPALTLLFREFSYPKYQVVQESQSALVVILDSDQQHNLDEDKKLIEILEYHCGEGVKIELRKDGGFLIPSSGKFRFIINQT